MIFRKATMADLPTINDMYMGIVQRNVNDNTCLWDSEIYPFSRLAGDIDKGELYILTDESEVLSSIVLTEDIGEGSAEQIEDSAEWTDKDGKALFIFRFGVNANYLRQGISGKVLSYAVETARDLGYSWLKLYVMKENIVAIHMYEKFGFRRVAGEHIEHLDDDMTINEYCYELTVN